MTPEHIVKLSWSDIEQHVGFLAEKIRASGFVPDYLIGITTGGLVPVGLLAKALDINRIVTISASSYEKEKRGELSIFYLPEVDLRGKKVLLIDEIADSGTTLKEISKVVLEKYSPAELKTVVIATNKEKCTFRPDFYALEANGWIVFPWEKADFPEYF